MKYFTVGPQALLVELESLDAVLDLAAEVEDRHAAGWQPHLRDVVPGACTLLLDGLRDPGAVGEQISSWTVAPRIRPPGKLVEIFCRYDGTDLEEVAAIWGVKRADVARIHAGVIHEVAFCGFLPGFAYLSGIGEARRVPRKATPATAVPAGSVALAGAYTGIYPRSSPGGWLLIGESDVVLFQREREPPGLLQPGDRVRFVDVARAES